VLRARHDPPPGQIVDPPVIELHVNIYSAGEASYSYQAMTDDHRSSTSVQFNCGWKWNYETDKYMPVCV